MHQILLELTALLFLWLGLRVWQHDRSARGRHPFMGLCAAGFLWCAGTLGCLHGALDVRAADRLAYLGLLLVPPLWMCLALAVRGSEIVRRAPSRLAVLFAPAVLCYALLYANEAAYLFVPTDRLEGASPGPLWWLNAGYSWLLGLLGSIHFLEARSRNRDAGARLRGRVVGLVTLAPTLGNAAWILAGMPGSDPTPVLLVIATLAIRNELFAGDLLQMLPVSRHDLLSHVPVPLILVDLADRVIAINPAAEQTLGVGREDALDRSVELVLEEALDPPAFERWSLVAAGREAGGILIPVGKGAPPHGARP